VAGLGGGQTPANERKLRGDRKVPSDSMTVNDRVWNQAQRPYGLTICLIRSILPDR
jgi:hypothetical protein